MEDDSFIPVSEPNLAGNERKYVLDCIDTNWISSKGKYVELFEEAVADYLGVENAIAVSNGTAALHLALSALGIGPGDEVIVPTLTFVATANAAKYNNAKVVFADIKPDTWNIDPTDIEQKITPQTKAVVPVHLYGHPCDMEPILELASKYSLYVIEDAAEAIGSQYKGQKVGGLGDVGTFSFYGNKTITTGEGGMVVTNNDQLAQKVRTLKGQGMDLDKRYWFPIMGYNYRMTNIQAAIGLAQMERIEYYVQRKREIAKLYHDQLSEIPEITLPVEKEWGYNTYWMYSILIEDNFGITRDEVRDNLHENGIETRPFFYPLHTMPMYQKDYTEYEFPIANEISRKGINLPSGTKLTDSKLTWVTQCLKNLMRT